MRERFSSHHHSLVRWVSITFIYDDNDDALVQIGMFNKLKIMLLLSFAARFFIIHNFYDFKSILYSRESSSFTVCVWVYVCLLILNVMKKSEKRSWWFYLSYSHIKNIGKLFFTYFSHFNKTFFVLLKSLRKMWNKFWFFIKFIMLKNVFMYDEKCFVWWVEKSWQAVKVRERVMKKRDDKITWKLMLHNMKVQVSSPK